MQNESATLTVTVTVGLLGCDETRAKAPRSCSAITLVGVGDTT